MMILGLVRWMQPVHGYDVRRELLSWSADKWANVQPGSIYHALRKLTDEGLLRTVSTEQVGGRPARTTYEVTAKGEDEFETLLRAQWWQLHEPPDPFVAAFSFLPAMPREEAAAALRNRANLLRAGIESMRASLESEWVRNTKPVHVGWMFELWSARAEAEMAWCVRVAERIESGVSYLPAAMERAEGWPGWTDGAAEERNAE
ncbi:DNA-binding transcriptional regulator, PadR family [Micromonospora viridifaciens]|uniref:DNA-binding transcriptional regulator, PadR family n=2 Tax=Micromonospora viridifaciens TaxID=1881 RepID=A0A1C4ZV48_MICVI|nr:DNA-binding transcriptional regulator, PadR family [Micromonospora viridifaciens]